MLAAVCTMEPACSDRLLFIAFYCLPAFVAPSSSIYGTPPYFSSSSSLPPHPNNRLPSLPRECVQRAADGAHAGGGGGAHAGLGDSEAASVTAAVKWNDFFTFLSRCANSHTGTSASRGREGVKVPVGKPDADLSVWHGTAARPKPS